MPSVQIPKSAGNIYSEVISLNFLVMILNSNISDFPYEGRKMSSLLGSSDSLDCYNLD